jgi:hypothetical protein
MYVKDLQNNVPLYGQEKPWWCGAACAQMARNGYPNPADRLFFSQQDLWNSIVANNSATTSMGKADVGWATDPQGLTACLQTASNPAGVHWAAFADTSSYTVLFSMLYWMNVREYPAPTLMDGGGHWVVVVGWQTDVEPLAGSTPVLQALDYCDPQPDNVGAYTHALSSQWVLPAGPAATGPWKNSVMYAGTWANDYVAIVEPPVAEGTVIVKPAKRTGEKLLTPTQAVAAADRAIREQRLAANPRFALLIHPNAERLIPLLVREEPPVRPAVEGARKRTQSRTAQTPYYYIVPFGLSGERSRAGNPLVRVCVLVNAYSGAFEEATAFGRPVSHLTEKEALAEVARALHITPAELTDAEATLLFRPSAITHVRAYPFWRIKVGARTLYVDQLGNLHSALRPSIAGD